MDTNFGGSAEGYVLAVGEPTADSSPRSANVEISQVVETFYGCGGRGEFRMGSGAGGRCGQRDLVAPGAESVEPPQRDDCDTSCYQDLPCRDSGKEVASLYRQHGGVLGSKERWYGEELGGAPQGNRTSISESGGRNRGCRLDTLGEDESTRSRWSLQDNGSGRLDCKTGDRSGVVGPLGGVRFGSIRERAEYCVPTFPGQMVVSPSLWSQRVCLELDRFSLLDRPTCGAHRSGSTISPGRGARLRRDPSCSLLAKPILVARSSDNRARHARPRENRGGHNSKKSRERRTLEEQGMENGGSQTLSDHVTKLIDLSRAQSTVKTYLEEWRSFEEFMAERKKEPLGCSRRDVEEYLAWLDLMAMSWRGVRAIYAIKWMHDKFDLPFAINGRLKLLVDALEKKAKNERVVRRRDPFPIGALRKWMIIENRPTNWLRDAAVVVLGLRAMRRASELAELRLRDIEIEENRQIMWVFVRRAKNDQLARGLNIPIEATGGLTCPVRIVSAYLAQRRGSSPDDYVFEARRSVKLSSQAISSIVQRMARMTGFSGVFSSHSLRIGGATAAMAAGITKEQIMTIGGWSSDAVDRYLRPLETVQLRASSRMGL